MKILNKILIVIKSNADTDVITMPINNRADWVVNAIFRRLKRSVKVPAYGIIRIVIIASAKAIAPSVLYEPVSSQVSQKRAVLCTHKPTLEIHPANA